MAITIANGFGCEPSWIAAALRIVPEDPSVFRPSRITDAMSIFGIGNKKVEALCQWLRSMGLVVGTPTDLQLSHFGRLITALDPSLRRPGTWWALHLMLALPSEQRVRHDVWQWFANEPFFFGFSTQTLHEAAGRAFPEATERTVKTGLNEVLKTLRGTPLEPYCLMPTDATQPTGALSKAIPLDVPVPILLTGVARQMEDAGRDTLNAEELAIMSGGAARVLNIPCNVMIRMLERAAALYGSNLIAISRTAGLDSVWLGERAATFWLAVYYAEDQGTCPQMATEVARMYLEQTKEATSLES